MEIPLRSFRRIWKNNIKMCLIEIVYEVVNHIDLFEYKLEKYPDHLSYTVKLACFLVEIRTHFLTESVI
jgi:hypothetical protein